MSDSYDDYEAKMALAEHAWEKRVVKTEHDRAVELGQAYERGWNAALAQREIMDIEKIRVRIMSEAYDLADRGDFEGYNAVKVMCGDVLESIAAVIAAEREACAKVCEDIDTEYEGEDVLATWCATAIRARGNK